MSTNICLDPKQFYNFQDQSCDSPPDLPKDPQPTQGLAPELIPATLPPSAPAKGLRRIEDFRAALLPLAAKGSGVSSGQGIRERFLGFSLLSLFWACSSDESKDPAYRPRNDADASTGGVENSTGGRRSGTGGSGGSSGTGAAAGAGGTSGASGADGGMNHSDGGAIGGNLDPAVLFGTTPCGADGMIPDLDQDVGLCVNVNNGEAHLFSWNSQNGSSSDGGGQVTSLMELGYQPDQVLRSSSGKYYITDYASGLGIVDLGNSVQDQMIFPQVVTSPKATSKGTMVTQISPSYPKGLAEIGNRLFIATSNLVIVPMQVNQADGGTAPIETYFNPGAVLIYNTASSSWEHYLVTTDFNPTGVAAINGKIYVVNSGDINPNRTPMATSPSSIDVINPQTLQIEKNIPLGYASQNPDAGTTGPRGNVAAGIHGEIAVSSDGNTMVLPTGDNSGRLIVVDIPSGSTRTITVATGSKVLLTGVTFHPSDQIVYVGNFNDGKIYTVDLQSSQVVGNQTLDHDTTNFSGISDGLWQGGAVFMGVGTEIFRLPARN